MFNEIGVNAQKASKIIARLSTEEKNTVLHDMSQELIKNKDGIIASNKLDLEIPSITHLSKPYSARVPVMTKTFFKLKPTRRRENLSWLLTLTIHPIASGINLCQVSSRLCFLQ